MNNIIQKAPETMDAKTRTRKTFNLEKTDRVTIGYEANDAIHMRFSKALGIPDGNMELVYQALGVDYRGLPMKYIGPQLFPEPGDGKRVDPVDGYIMRWSQNESGGYWDFCDFPLKDAEDEQFYSFPVPNPDDFDYQLAYDYAKACDKYAVYIGSPGFPDILNGNGRLMGMEDIYCNLAMGHEAAVAFVNRRAAMQLGFAERILDKCKGLVDFVWMGEDLGTQIAPIIGLDLYRKYLRPIQEKFVDLAKSYDLPVIVHTCGSSSWVYEDFIEMGIRGVDTLQPEAVNMSPAYLKEKFGTRLCFRGCISTAGPLAYGTADEVTQVCRETLDTMMKGYGYHFAPTHLIQDNSPTENVIAMYNAAHRCGVYK